jgi:hypothetical protein
VKDANIAARKEEINTNMYVVIAMEEAWWKK